MAPLLSGQPRPAACSVARLPRSGLALEPAELRAAARAFARLAVVPGPLPDPCWVYTGARNADGYGVARVGDRMVLVHRLIYTALVGPIPPDRELHHRCEIRACARAPLHLDPLTHAENHALSARAQQTHCLRGHEFNDLTTGRHAERGTRYCMRCERDRQRRLRGLNDIQIELLERAYQEQRAA